MSFHDEYRIVINESQRRLIVRALTKAPANDRHSTVALGLLPICCQKCREGYLRWRECRP
jgi:hypothetical protein